MYKLPSHIDPNKIFIIQFSELERRFDPYYYNPHFKVIDGKLSKIEYSTIRKESIKIFSGITPKSGGSDYTNQIEGVPFIRSGDFDEENRIDFNGLNYVKAEVHNKLMKASQLNKFDMLIAIVGATIGKVGVYNYDLEANINQAICAVRFKENINPYFVQIFLLTSFGQTILNRLKRPVARANINLEEIASIPIPQLPKEVQQEIVDFYDNAIKKKQSKEIQAQELLASIDDYLLGELGITLPAENIVDKVIGYQNFELNGQNPLVKNGRLFLTRFSEVSGGRLDPKNSLYLGKKSKSIIYENIALSKIAIIEKGQSITSKEVVEGEYPVIAGGQSSPYSHNQYNNEANIITVSASGAYAGFVWYHDYPIFASDCSVIRSKDESLFSTKYIFEVLKAKQKEIYFLQQGAGQPHVYSTDLEKILIPAVSKDIQDKVVCHIKSIRHEIQELQKKAMKVIEQAKEETEKMILK